MLLGTNWQPIHSASKLGELAVYPKNKERVYELTEALGTVFTKLKFLLNLRIILIS